MRDRYSDLGPAPRSALQAVASPTPVKIHAPIQNMEGPFILFGKITRAFLMIRAAVGNGNRGIMQELLPNVVINVRK